jgi:uncharacterized membrane protein
LNEQIFIADSFWTTSCALGLTMALYGTAYADFGLAALGFFLGLAPAALAMH